MATFALKGNYLYVVDNQDLNVFSLNDPSEPVLANKVPIGFDIETLFGYRDFLYIGSRTGMFIYGLTNSEFPNKLSSVEHFTACDPVVANDTHASALTASHQGTPRVTVVRGLKGRVVKLFFATMRRSDLVGHFRDSSEQCCRLVCEASFKQWN